MSRRSTKTLPWRGILSADAALDRAIMAAIEDYGNAGVICHDVEKRIGELHQAVSGNITHLHKKHKLLEPTGSYGLTPSRRRAMKWKLSRKARGAAA